MQIKFQALAGHLQKSTATIYMVIGNEPYLQDEAARMILANVIPSVARDDVSVFHINQASDWQEVETECLQLSLFQEKRCLDLRMEKATLDAAGKKQLQALVTSPPKDTFILIRAPLWTLKTLGTIVNEAKLIVVTLTAFKEAEMTQWIDNRLKTFLTSPTKTLAAQIYQYTQNNMLAAHQAIERLMLTPDNPDLFMQAEFELFEIKDALLLGNLEKLLTILQKSAQDKTEIILVLWQFTDELRTLLSLHLALKTKSFSDACQHIGIWQSKTGLYQQALKRMSENATQTALLTCQHIDETIKSKPQYFAWQKLDRLALYCCQPVECVYG